MTWLGELYNGTGRFDEEAQRLDEERKRQALALQLSKLQTEYTSPIGASAPGSAAGAGAPMGSMNPNFTPPPSEGGGTVSMIASAMPAMQSLVSSSKQKPAVAPPQSESSAPVPGQQPFNPMMGGAINSPDQQQPPRWRRPRMAQ